MGSSPKALAVARVQLSQVRAGLVDSVRYIIARLALLKGIKDLRLSGLAGHIAFSERQDASVAAFCNFSFFDIVPNTSSHQIVDSRNQLGARISSRWDRLLKSVIDMP